MTNQFAARRGIMLRARGIALVFAMASATILVGNAAAQQKTSSKEPNAPMVRYSIQIEPVFAEEDELPPDFAMAIYENLVEQVTKSGKFESVFRSGDKRAAEVPNLLILRSTLKYFQHGSQTKRAVTTVAGATKISVIASLVTRESQVRLERQVDGKVRLFGENLKATQALAKNIAKAIN